MTAADGHVVRKTKVVDHGPDSRRWTIVILSEGYRDAELPKFRTDANTFIERLFRTVPYTDMWCALNIYLVEVASTNSGADDPVACSDGTAGTGAAPKTFFDAKYCKNGSDRRLLSGDSTLAKDTAKAQVPEVDATVVIINNAQYGGAGGTVAWFSTAPTAALIGIHELGHSAFRLADEYGDRDNTWSGGEPLQPNITTATTLASIKWKDLIKSTPVPRMDNSDATCATEENDPSPYAAGTVGLFAGGGRARCGVFRAEHNCMMKKLDQPFCAVCCRALRNVLRPHLPRASGPTSKVQFSAALAAGETKRWFTHNWPACWHVVWSVAPKSPVTPKEALTWRVQVERASRERLTYWIKVTNLTTGPIEFEARYSVMATD
jgi:hypothetical protein